MKLFHRTKIVDLVEYFLLWAIMSYKIRYLGLKNLNWKKIITDVIHLFSYHDEIDPVVCM